MVAADLHVHTTNSDGLLELSELPAVAREAGLEAVAVTDHDRLHPGIDAPISDRDGVTIIHGVELRVEPTTRNGGGSERVDLLGYGVEPTQALRATIDSIQRDRIDRGRRIVEKLEAELGVELDVSVERGLGRPDIARAVVDHPALDYAYETVFEEFIGNGESCYVAREVPSFDRGLEVLRNACSVVGLAHPLRYRNVDAALELTAVLDAVEVYYPYDRPVDISAVRAAVDRRDLLVTGGSDAHDDQLGVAGLDEAEYGRLHAAIRSGRTGADR